MEGCKNMSFTPTIRKEKKGNPPNPTVTLLEITRGEHRPCENEIQIESVKKNIIV